MWCQGYLLKIALGTRVLLQGTQSGNGLKARVGGKKADDTALAVTTHENVKTFDKKFAVPLDFDFFKYPAYSYRLKEDLIVRLKLNSTEKVIIVTGDPSATYKFLDISPE